MSFHEKKERNDEIQKLVENKVSVSDIAKKFKISKIRVYQIINFLKIKKIRDTREKIERDRQINKMYNDYPPFERRKT